MIEPTLPLIDLHRHLDGNVRLETILELGEQHHLILPAWDTEGLRPYIQVTDPQPGVMAFISRFHWLTAVLVDYEACRRIAYENVADAHREGLDYVELRFSPWFMAQANQLDPTGVVEAVVDGVNAGRRDFNQPVNLIGILSRTYGPKAAWLELQSLLSHKEQIVALDLAGDEENWPGELFVDHFYLARQAGWQITVHAGEIDGADSIWQALTELGAVRIGHAVHAIDDPALIDFMHDRQIGIEVSLTSNVQTRTVASYRAHPLKKFLQKGLLATLCSDDPGISGIDLNHEYDVAAVQAGLSHRQIKRAQRNALEIAFLSDSEKVAILARKRPERQFLG
ncbi:MAG: add [Chloroflexi bacterium]|nr:add [Chloroflexota bacterium]